MKGTVLGFAGALSLVAWSGLTAQTAPTAATYITNEEVQAVNAATGTDRQIRVVDLGEYQLAVGIVHRGRSIAQNLVGGGGAPPAAGANAAGGGGGAGAAAGGASPAGAAGGGGAAAGGGGAAGGAGGGGGGAAAAAACGVVGTPSANAVAGGIAHDQTTETYIIVSGGGTLVTGGRIMNGRRSTPTSSVTTVLNGPSCSGSMDGPDLVRKVVKTGDIIIIPAGVPHGWTEIADHVDYLSVRPDLDKVLEHGYVHPAIRPPAQ